MGALMFDAAREMILASFPSDLPKDEVKRRLFARLYGKAHPMAVVRETMDKKYSA
jgi:hypothetical protein